MLIVEITGKQVAENPVHQSEKSQFSRFCQGWFPGRKPIQAIGQLPVKENGWRGRSGSKVPNHVGEFQFFPHRTGYLDFVGKVGVLRENCVHVCPSIFFMLEGLQENNPILADYPK
jgi:hypothetical protein